MQYFKIGKNAIHIVWAINDINGNPRDLSRLIPSVFYACGGGRVEAQYVEVKENIISWTFPAREQKVAGTYALSLVLKNLDGTEYSRLYRAEAFTLTQLRANDTIMAVQTEGEQTIYLTACMTLADTSNKADLFYVDNRLEQVETNAREYADAAVAGHVVIFDGTNSFAEIKDAIQRDIPIIGRFPAGTNIGGITIDTTQMAAATTKMDDFDVISLRFVFSDGISFFQATYDAYETDETLWRVDSDYLATRDDLASKPDIFILSTNSTSEEVRNAINKKMFIAVASNRPDTDGGYLFADYANIANDGTPQVFFHYITNQTVYELEYYYDISTSDGDWRISKKEYTILASNDIPIEKGTGSSSVVQSGAGSVASGDYSFAEGYQSVASGLNSHAEGYKTAANNAYSHSEGGNTISNGKGSHAEGYDTLADNNHSHAEGFGTKAYSLGSHAEGYNTIAGVSGHTSGYSYSHAEGHSTQAKGQYSHSEGYYTQAVNSGEHSEGTYNLSIKDKTIHTVGIGSTDIRKNAHEIHLDGSHYIHGIGGYDGTNSQTAQSIQTVLSNIQSKTDATISSLSNKVNQDTYAMDKEYLEMRVNSAESLARGAQRALVYADYSKLVTALNAGMVGTDVLPKGQSIYIQQLDVPDLWVSNFRAPDELTEYTYTNDADFLEYIKGGGWIGCHQLSLLETAKVDLSNTASKTEVTALQEEVAALKAIINEITIKE